MRSQQRKVYGAARAVLEPLERRIFLTLLPADPVEARLVYQGWADEIDNKVFIKFTDNSTSETGYRPWFSTDEGATWTAEAIVAAVPGSGSQAPEITYQETSGQPRLWMIETLNSVNPPNPAIFSAVFRYKDKISRDFSIRLQSTINSSGDVTFTWPEDITGVQQWSVHRKARGASTWTDVLVDKATYAPSGNGMQTYTDTARPVGSDAEYRVTQFKVVNNVSVVLRYGYIYVGHKAPVSRMENRGNVLLVISNDLNDSSSSMNGRLARLMDDLRGDGWHVVPPLLVARDSGSTSSRAEAVAVKASIQSRYDSYGGLSAIILVGRVPVPYAGQFAHDGHTAGNNPPDHSGAWPSDAAYGNLTSETGDGTYTDTGGPFGSTTANNGFDANYNVSSDNKWDNTVNPGKIDVPVGRIDMSNLEQLGGTWPPTSEPPPPPLTGAALERALLSQYLDKDHNWRIGDASMRADTRALIDDHSGTKQQIGNFVLGGAASAWGHFSALVGRKNTFGYDYYPTTAVGTVAHPNAKTFLWGMGTGNGSPTQNFGVIDTSAYGNPDQHHNVVFSAFFGSYFGDFDKADNLLRATLGDNGRGLTTVWAARPEWHFEAMGLGEPIGGSLLQAQNNGATLAQEFNNGYVGGDNDQVRAPHVALLGDPTVRMHVVRPPTNVTVAGVAETHVINWTASADDFTASRNAGDFIGYHIYVAHNVEGPFTRITTNPVTSGTTYVRDMSGMVQYPFWRYMVRAIKLEQDRTATGGPYVDANLVRNSGTYYNMSQAGFGEYGSQGGYEGESSGGGEGEGSSMMSSYGPGSSASSLAAMAPAASLRVFDQLGDIWTGTNNDLNSLMANSFGSGGQLGSSSAWHGWSSSNTLQIDVKLTGGQGYKILALSFASTSAGQKVELVNPKTGAVIDARTVGASENGKTLRWKVAGHVKVKITNPAGGAATLLKMKVLNG